MATLPGKRPISLRVSLGSAFVGVVLLTILLLGAVTLWNTRTFVRQGVRERLHDAVGIAALQIDGDLHRQLQHAADEDSPAYRTLKKQLQTIRGHVTGIRYAYTMRKNAQGEYLFVVDAEEGGEASHVGDLYDAPTSFMAAAFEAPYAVQVEDRFYEDRWGNWLTAYAPFFDGAGRLEGILAFDISAAQVLEYERRNLMAVLGIALASSVLVVMLSIVLARRICQPLLLLETDLKRIEQFDLDHELRIRSRVIEIINMRDAIESMKNGLRSFKKYVPASLVAELIRMRKEAVLEAEKRPVTIFFSDIADFMQVAEALPPEDLVRHLGDYFDRMSQCIARHHGTVDKYIGDAIMAFWGAPLANDEHALLACRAALDCQRQLTVAAAEWRERGLPLLPTRIGINTGEATVGNFGSAERLNYTVMGDNVNVASRLEGLNRDYGTAILISEATFLQVRHAMAGRIIDRVVVKGKTIGTTVYELIAEKGALTAEEKSRIDLFNTGMEAFLAGRLAAAGDVFASITSRWPEDRHAATMLARCSGAEELVAQRP